MRPIDADKLMMKYKHLWVNSSIADKKVIETCIEFINECPTVNTECDIIIPEYDEVEQQLDDDFWDNYFDNLSPYEID